MAEQNAFLRDLKEFSYSVDTIVFTDEMRRILKHVNAQFSDDDWIQVFSFSNQGEPLGNIKNWLRYRLLAQLNLILRILYQNDPDKCHLYREFTDDCDCDYRVFRMYNMMLSKENPEDQRDVYGQKSRIFTVNDDILLETDTMNSFATLFNSFLRKRFKDIGLNLVEAYGEQFSIDTQKLTDTVCRFYRDAYFMMHMDEWYHEWTDAQALFREFNKFAQYTHCLANMILVPKNFNTGRYHTTKDFWDLSLMTLQKRRVENAGFAYMAEHMDDFLLTDWFSDCEGSVVKPLFPKHSFDHKMPMDDGEYLACIEEINLRIEARAKRLAKSLSQFQF